MKQAEKKTIPARAASEAHELELRALDPELHALLDSELHRQRDKIILIASESICPQPVLAALASSFTNIYAEGYPSSRMAVQERDSLSLTDRHLAFYRRYGDRRYYRGCDFVNLVESLAIKRVCELFATPELPAESLYANVQPLSGAAANNAVYNAFLKPGDTVMGMHLSYGGHLTHGSPVNRSGRLFRIVPYTANPTTGEIDWDGLKALARREAPKLVIAGASSFPWAIDWARFREVADASPAGAILLADIAHHAGLIAAGVLPSPLPHADVVSFTTHKTLCGPRGAVLLTADPQKAKALDLGVFPGEQGGPHINAIAAKAVSFAVAKTEAFRELMAGVLANARALADALRERGQTLAYGGTNTHLCIVDLKGLRGAGESVLSADIAARLLDLAGITCNKNAIAGDLAAAHPSGLRFGLTWATQRGLGPADMTELALAIDGVLRAMRPYTIHATGGMVGRAKIDPRLITTTGAAIAARLARAPDPQTLHDGLFAQGAARVAPRRALENPLAALHEESGAELVLHHGRRVPAHFGDQRAEDEAAGKNAIVLDCSDKGVISVRGERALAMLQAVTTVDLTPLEPGSSRRAAMLDAGGALIDDLLVHRLLDGAHGHAHYLLSVHAPARERLLAWLQALSDGYADFDTAGDPYRKIDGPVVVEDLSELDDDAHRRVVLGVAGPSALELLADASRELRDLTQFQMRQVTIARAPVMVSVGSLNLDDPTIELYVSAQHADAVYRELLKLGASRGVRPAGLRARHALRRKAGLPTGEQPTRAADLATRLPHLFDLRKPYFVGRSALAPGTDAAHPKFAFELPPMPLRTTPLIDEHRARTAKWNLVPFAGWEMPVLYTSIVEEHQVVRSAAGLFDVAHMGVLEVAGRGAERFLDLVTTNYVPRLRDQQCQYSYVLDPSGGVMDDIIVYRRGAERFMVVVNASNAEKIFAWFQAVNARKVAIDETDARIEVDATPAIRDLKSPAAGADRRVDLAFQGPQSLAVLAQVCDRPDLARRLAQLDRFEMAEGTVGGGIDLVIARTGYTGEEQGFELFVHPDRARELFLLLLERGASVGVRPTGLGARDSTRTEAGFPLYGHELAGSLDLSPFGAGYPGFVKLHKPFFVGREATLRREAARRAEVVRLELAGAQVRAVRPGDPVVDGRGRCVGSITSACYVGSSQIALAYIERDQLREGARVAVFNLPRDGKALPLEKAKDRLGAGDRVLLPIEGKVLPRFLSKAEREARIRASMSRS